MWRTKHSSHKIFPVRFSELVSPWVHSLWTKKLPGRRRCLFLKGLDKGGFTVQYIGFLPQIYIALGTVLLKSPISHVKLTWVGTHEANFDLCKGLMKHSFASPEHTLLPRLLCVGGEKKAPGTHCLCMHQVSLVTCIPLHYTKITGNFFLPYERPQCRIILPTRHVWAEAEG